MDFNLSREHQLIRKMMAEFTEKEVKPIAAETDRTCEYPRENIEKLFDLGVMGMCVPKEYGGAGADPLASAICIEELSKQCASTGDIVATHNGLCCDPIMNYGTEAQKQKYLPMLTTGHHVGAFALTEPNAGSDASKGQTEAKLEGDHYVMNGSKIFITNGYVADVFVVFAMTDKTRGTKGISAFIVESGFPGFSVGKHEEKLGLHGSPTAEIVFQDCIVPKENLLGVEGKGFSIAMATLDGGRIGIAAQALGIAEGALAEAINYTKGRVQFGKPISKFQNTQFTLADMELGCEAGRLLTYQAAVAKGEGKRYTKLAAMAKLFTSEHAMKTTTKVVQLFGGYGYTKDYPVERMMRDAKITEIYEGTSDDVLLKGVGHLEGSSYPLGGAGTHSVLTGHRGLAEAVLFTDLDKLGEGERFYLHIMDEVLAYQVDQVKVVEPENTEDLEIIPGGDYCTLVTCTPYAINTHRMLVRGARVPYTGEDEQPDTPQTVQYQQLNTGNVVKRIVDAWPWISVTGSVVIGGEALLLLLLLHRCKKREEED